MTEVEKIEQLRADYQITLQQLKAAHNAARDLVGAVGDRLRSERKQTAARTAQLTAQAADQTRSETVRRVAEMELSKIRSRSFTPTAEETAAFEEELKRVETAKKDAANLQNQMRAAVDDANKRLSEIRAAVMGDETPSLSGTWCEGLKRDFENLSEA